ncbi:MAG: tetratricopeptide repeat protein [Pyrinomonadaceae bacterium]
MRSILIITIGAIAMSSQVFAQAVGASRGTGMTSGSYSVTGKVMLPDNKPAVGVRVNVTCDFTTVSADTDPDGTYRVTGVPAGNCTITAKVPGFDPATENRQITRDTPFGMAIYVPLFVRANPYSTANPLFKDVPKQALEKFKSGMGRVEKGNADAALALFDAAISLYPKFAVAWYQKGQILLGKNDVDKAIESFVKAIEIAPNYMDAKYAFGMAQLQIKNYEVSEAVFRDVLKQTPDMSGAHLNLGISLFYLEKLDEAEAELKSAVASKTGDKLALAHLYLGQIYVQKKRNADAITELRKYLDMVPKAPNAERLKTVIADLKKQS